MICDYDYLSANSMQDLQKEVQQYLEEHDGWEPAGGVAVVWLQCPDPQFEGHFFYDFNFYQALKKVMMGPRGKLFQITDAGHYE